LSKLPQAGVRRRAELLYQQLDGLQALRREVRPEFLAESRKHKAAKLLRQIPCIGPIRAARLIALMQTPHRFRSGSRYPKPTRQTPRLPAKAIWHS
jgi:transposase